MAKAEIKTVEKKLNVKYSDGVYVALDGGDSEAMLNGLVRFGERLEGSE